MERQEERRAARFFVSTVVAALVVAALVVLYAALASEDAQAQDRRAQNEPSSDGVDRSALVHPYYNSRDIEGLDDEEEYLEDLAEEVADIIIEEDLLGEGLSDVEEGRDSFLTDTDTDSDVLLSLLLALLQNQQETPGVAPVATSVEPAQPVYDPYAYDMAV